MTPRASYLGPLARARRAMARAPALHAPSPEHPLQAPHWQPAPQVLL